MEQQPLNPQDVERAKTFWASENVDRAFDVVFECLNQLMSALKNDTATDRQYVQGLELLEALGALGSCPPASPPDSVVQVVIGSGDSHHSASPSPTPPSNGPSSSTAPPAGRRELLSALTPVKMRGQLHSCCKACLSSLPSMHRSKPPFWGQNPLKIPLLCGFKRLTSKPRVSSRWDGDCEEDDWDVLYKAPCGRSLHGIDDVRRFLLTTDSYDILQVDFFTFNPSVRLDPPQSADPKWPELDLSQGTEAAPVQLCPGDGDVRPPNFRYRKDRWPHGCFLSRGLTLFETCCDCTDGCSDAQRCACVAMTTGGRHYSHHRLYEPVPSGVYECGPWCGCDRARCQNRLVQRGISVRLQVFHTGDRGWGVRCRDDLDRGTFVCIFAGVILQRVQSPSNSPSPKLPRVDLPSDDEVEVITEWLAPTVQEGRSHLLQPTSPPPHVPVIQRSPDASATAAAKDRDKTVLLGGQEAPPPSAGGSGDQKKRAMKAEDVFLVDASKEGNVSRFLNHSCRPNLFVQNVFADSHDCAFPVVAFFTNSVVTAGTELTWNYSAGTQRKQEVPCLCGSDGCQGDFSLENLYDVCEVEVETQ